MSNSAALRVLNPLLLVVLLAQGTTGVGLGLFNWEAVEDFHAISGVTLLVLGLVHLGLNWRWVRTAYRKHAAASKPPAS
jgi:hypothetical protein